MREELRACDSREVRQLENQLDLALRLCDLQPAFVRHVISRVPGADSADLLEAVFGLENAGRAVRRACRWRGR
jgi:hypothetical protein